jgi:hypothetical protein
MLFLQRPSATWDLKLLVHTDLSTQTSVRENAFISFALAKSIGAGVSGNCEQFKHRASSYLISGSVRLLEVPSRLFANNGVWGPKDRRMVGWMVRVVLVLGLAPRVCFRFARTSRRLNLGKFNWYGEVSVRARYVVGGFLLIDGMVPSWCWAVVQRL